MWLSVTSTCCSYVEEPALTDTFSQHEPQEEQSAAPVGETAFARDPGAEVRAGFCESVCGVSIGCVNWASLCQQTVPIVLGCVNRVCQRVCQQRQLAHKHLLTQLTHDTCFRVHQHVQDPLPFPAAPADKESETHEALGMVSE
jgi:hypothetical protein